jgi:cysteate synthase
MNKGPAYGQVGVVHDILKDSNGQTYVAERSDAVAAKTLFESIEGIDIMTPSAVALPSLQQALASGDVDMMHALFSTSVVVLKGSRKKTQQPL